MVAQDQQLPRHSNNSVSGPLVFVSYARTDGIEFAQELANWLKSNGYVPWLDVHGGIRGGDAIDVSIEQAIKACLAVVVVLTEGSARNDTFVRKELQYATDCGATIIPVRLSEDVPPPITIATTHWLEAEEALGPVLIEVLGGVPKQRVISHSPMRRNDSQNLRRLNITHLPLPLAQLWKRARNAKTAHERHLSSYYLWEAALKLIAFVAIVEYARRPEHDPELTSRLKNLTRPNIGQWWEFVRRLLPVLAERGDEPFRNLRDLVLGPVRDDLPLAAGMDAAIAAVLEPDTKHASRVTARVSDLFHRMVMYRNREIGHLGLRPADYYDRMASVMLNGLTDLLRHLNVLAERRLIYVSEVSFSESGSHVIHRFELIGEEPQRLKTWEVNECLVGRLPKPGRIYLESPYNNKSALEQNLPDLVLVHPLAIFDADSQEVLFLDGRRTSDRAGYKGYITGNDRLEILSEDHSTLLQRVLGISVSESDISAWADESVAETPIPESVRLKGREPKKLGEFELLSRIGKGGMGVVYRAFQPSLGRQVALKRLSKPDDEKAVSRFSREIRALGRIEHPNIVRIFTSGSDGEEYFYAMELIEGADLSNVCAELSESTVSTVSKGQWQTAVSSACRNTRNQERPLSDENISLSQNTDDFRRLTNTFRASSSAGPKDSYIRIVVGIAKQVAEAANELHENGVVHRDIKPGNIIVTKDGFPILMDLGLAQLADSVEGRLTRTRQIVGTLRYASPEQILAVDRLDRRSDVYSLGATLWELLTLQPLFGATDETPDNELIKSIEFREPGSVRHYNHVVERDLASIVEKCLEKNPAARYETAAALADDLGRWLSGEKVKAFPRTPLYLVVKLLRRYHRQVVAIALAAVFIIGAGSFYWEAFVRPSSTICANWIFRHRLVEGYGKLSVDQVRHRETSTRFIRRGWWGPVIRVEALNGRGQPKRGIGSLIGVWSDPDLWVSTIDFQHGANGRIILETGKDPNGNVIWELVYHGENSTSANFLDRRGLIRPLSNSTATHVHFVRDAYGNDIKTLYTDTSGSPRPNANGSYGRIDKFNEQGFSVESTYLGRDGEPAYTKDHFVKEKRQYDKMGNITEVSYYDSADNPIADRLGIWKTVLSFDIYGNRIRREFYDSNGDITLSTDYVAGWTSEYDDWGNDVRRVFFCLKGQVCRSVEGYAGLEFEYDDSGRNIGIKYLNIVGSIMEAPIGYAEVHYEYDKNDYLSAMEFYNNKGKRTVNSREVWRIEMVNDSYGNEIERRFFDIVGVPTVSKDGIGGWRSQFDVRGNEISRTYMTPNGDVATHSDGTSGWRSLFDEYGNETRTEYVDSENELTLVEGIAGWQSNYDQYGNETKREYFGVDGKPTRSEKGIYGWRSEFDSRGNETYRAYSGISGEPINHNDGYAAWRIEYDERNQARHREYLNLDSQKMNTYVVIEKVFPGTQADSVGLEQGDIVLEYNGVKGGIIEFMYEKNRLTTLSVSTDIIIRVARNGIRKTFKLRPGRIGIQWKERIVTSDS
jgi:serine/threonine protein kinase